MGIEYSTQIAAPAADVWAIVADVESWPSLTDSMDEVRITSQGPFGMGSTARVRQPKMPALTWTVTNWRPGRRFDWQAKSAGMTVSAFHEVTETSDGSRLSLGFRSRGLLVPLMELMSGKRNRQYVQMELAGMKRAAEQRTQAKG